MALTSLSIEPVARSRQSRRVMNGILCALALLSTASAAHAQTLTATLQSPVNGAVNFDLGQPIVWTSVPNAQAYYLYVGSAAGARDLLNSGETQATNLKARTLPPNQLLYVRLWTKVNGTWRYVDSRFTGAAPTSVITYPADGNSGADFGSPIAWTPVPTATSYYLYVGTSPGARDLVNSGETQTTSFPAVALPPNQVLYARLWTKVNGSWRYVDSSFAGATRAAILLSPINGARNADFTQPIRWTTVPNAQSYYLYVGTTAGAKDLINSGEVQTTTFPALSLPGGQLLYARVWTKVAGVWRYTDGTFTGTALPARLTTPADGSTTADLGVPFKWTAVSNAQSYYLYLGASQGAKDLLNSGEVYTTTYPVGSLPSNQTVYARLWTKIAGVWRYSDSSFSFLSPAATLTYPPDGATGVDTDIPASWPVVSGAQKYYLYVGTAKGARDLINSGETTATSYPIATVPPNRPVYVRLWTKIAGTWKYTDSTFTAGANAPAFVYPLNGAVNVDPSQPFQWTPSVHGQAHWIVVGTTPGAADVANSGEITRTTHPMPSTVRRTLYARVWSKVNGRWTRHTDIAFTLRPKTRRRAMVAPKDGDLAFDTVHPFEWTAVRLAQAYRLVIGTTAGATDVHDSGEIRVTRRFVPNLPVGVPLYGQIQTLVGGEWYVTDFTFTVGANSISNAVRVDSALWATDVVRAMAGADNRPFGWTPLMDAIAPRYSALCSDYAMMLLATLNQMNLGLQARRLDVSLNATQFDAHTLVELLEPDSQRWMLLDPTFDLTVRRADGTWATAEDMSASAQSKTWTDESYLFLGAAGDAYAGAYYLDYPMLFVNLHRNLQVPDPSIANPVLPLYTEIATPAAGYTGYVVLCTSNTVAHATVDGVPSTIACNAAQSTSGVFYASTIDAATATPDFRLFLVNRFVF